VVSVADGARWNLRISTEMPSSMTPSRTPSHISVCCARRTRGFLNSGTALAIASTPVSAEQPEANAFSSSSMPTDSVTGGSWPASVTTGWDRTAPPMITIAIAMMNATVGTMKTRADSATPHRFTPVIRASTARQSQTRAPYRAGNADQRAATPADTPTAALRT
jgi:hypothetical protein